MPLPSHYNIVTLGTRADLAYQVSVQPPYPISVKYQYGQYARVRTGKTIDYIKNFISYKWQLVLSFNFLLSVSKFKETKINRLDKFKCASTYAENLIHFKMNFIKCLKKVFPKNLDVLSMIKHQ